MQQCFAVQAGIHGLLDVARKTYSETIEDIHGLAQQYRDNYGIPSLKVLYSAS